MKFLTNLYDPTREDAEMKIIRKVNQTQDQAWESQKKWLVDKTIGKPQATKTYTIKDLEKMNMIGVYS